MQEKGTYFYEKSACDFQCDINGKMKLSNLLKDIQQIGTDQLDDLGITYDKLYASGIIFVLSKLALKINRMPVSNEKYVIKTTPQKTKGASFLRHTQIVSLNGEQLVECQAAWVIINPKERKILRPGEFKFSLPYNEHDVCGIQVLETHIKAPDIFEYTGEKRVLYSDLDVNRHMNNTVYGDIILDYLPIDELDNKNLDTVIIHYNNEATYGEVIMIKTDKIAENSYYIGGTKGEIKCFEAIVTFA